MDIDLFSWWAYSITAGSVFLTLVAIYIYARSKNKRSHAARSKLGPRDFVKDFVFVWVLLGLLAFYIVTINVKSPVIFAVGNVLVEVLLILYLRFNKTKATDADES